MRRNWTKVLVDVAIVTVSSALGILATRFIGVKEEPEVENAIESEPVSVEDAPVEAVSTEGE